MFNPIHGQKRFIAKLKRTSHRQGQFGLRKVPFQWFRDFLELDPEQIYRNTSCPTLAIAGSKDFQCLPEDLRAIETVIAAPIETHVIENMSHLLRHEPGEGSVFDYAEQMKQSLLPQVSELILDWLNRRIEAMNHPVSTELQ